MEKKTLDPRIAELINSAASPAVAFLLAAITREMPEEIIDEIFETLTPAGAGDLNRTVEGKPFHHWLGKSYEQILKETNGDDETAGRIVNEIEGAGQGAAVDALTGHDQGFITEHRQAGGFGAPPRTEDGKIDGEFPNADDPGSNVEPTFGEDQIPLSELAGMSDDEILGKPGIGAATLKRIRAEQEKRSAGGASGQ